MHNTEYLEMCLLMQIENNKQVSLVAGQETINCPAGAVFIRGIQVYNTARVRDNRT